MRRERRIFALAYAVMPDHLHLLVAPSDDLTLSEAMKAIKGFSARGINRRLGQKGSVWQEGFYDRVMRNEEQLMATIDYIHRNAVEAGLTKTPEEYVFSSAHPTADVDLDAFLGSGVFET
jgi:REP element-mobilizing transposase RayT